MPQCKICKNFLGPDFFWENPDNLINDFSKEIDQVKKLDTCQFCRENTSTLIIKGAKYSKDRAVYEYKEYISDLAKADNISEKLKELIVNTAVNKEFKK